MSAFSGRMSKDRLNIQDKKGGIGMNPTNCGHDPRSEQLDYMIQDALRILKEDIRSFSAEREKICDFIM
jgi:hypothetical protein